MAARLQRAGVQDARGFSTNVANYYPTAQEQAYAQKVSALTGGAHYVIDTSRNGQGWRGTWCNAPGAGLGTAPRVVTDGTALDALLWVKTPGASDGTCNGGPAAGKWYSAYAQALVANAALATATTSSAIGTVDRVDGGVSTVRVSGWAADQTASTTPLPVRVWVDGSTAGTTTADRPRQDVADSYGVGADHGYDLTLPAAAGSHEVCVSTTSVAGGHHPARVPDGERHRARPRGRARVRDGRGGRHPRPGGGPPTPTTRRARCRPHCSSAGRPPAVSPRTGPART
ncbi:glycoside hydrolase family 6 protein [Curtobacterium sp. MCJR17_043]|uniref:glycoside hydrolase family 6 protein n=1 Tax=Curtobacterium sp. MCJR17_043 TaxID=2175660 RepID=UPI0032E8572B